MHSHRGRMGTRERASMRSNSLLSVMIVFSLSFTSLHGKDLYQLVDIGECILPISSKYEKTMLTYYYRKNKAGILDVSCCSSILSYPIDSHNNIKLLWKLYDKKKFKKEYIGRFTLWKTQGTSDQFPDQLTQILLTKYYTILLDGYPEKETKYLIKYCQQTTNPYYHPPLKYFQYESLLHGEP